MLESEAPSSSSRKRPFVKTDSDGDKNAKRAKIDKKKMTVYRASLDEHKRFVKQVFSLPDSEWDETQVVKVGKEVVSLRDLGTIMPKQFLNDVAINAYKDMITARSNEYSFFPKDVPRQRNDFDCGVFVCQYADCLSRDQPIWFNPVQAPNVRRRMIYEVCHGKVLDV